MRSCCGSRRRWPLGPAGAAGPRRPPSADRARAAGRARLRAPARAARPAPGGRPRGWTRCCRCTATGWPASWPRSGPPTSPSAPPRPACSWPSTAARCRLPRWSASSSGRRAGRPASAWPRSRWAPTPTRNSSSSELSADDSALTGYLVEEVLNLQPPEVTGDAAEHEHPGSGQRHAASELPGDEQAGRSCPAGGARNAFVQPLGDGWYRYHTLFAEVLRLQLRREHPDRIALLHRRAARWYERNGSLADAVRHAAEAGDWLLAADLIIDGLADREIIETARRPVAGRRVGRDAVQPTPGPSSQPYAGLRGRPVLGRGPA